MFKTIISKQLFSQPTIKIKTNNKFLQSTRKMSNLTSTFVQKPPAKVGDHIQDIDTPALVVDLDLFETNLKLMKSKLTHYQTQFNLSELKLRPHYKTHKTPALALKQLELGGASGVCCATLTEVESLVFGSLSEKNWDILLTNEIVGKPKLERLANVAKHLQTKLDHPKLAVCVDHTRHVLDLIALCTDEQVQVNVYVEVNVGQHRGGVDQPEQVLELVQLIGTESRLHFLGLHAYNGANQHVRSFQQRKDTVLGPQVQGKLQDCIRLLQSNGFEVKNVTGAGTGTFPLEIESKVYNEIQAGSYAFMDLDYSINHQPTGTLGDEFHQALFIYSKVQNQQLNSKVSPRLICDAGLKALSLDSGNPKVLSPKGFKYISQGDEHGMLVPEILEEGKEVDKEGLPQVEVGDLVQLVPGHCDPTINMHDFMVAIRGDRVEQVWQVEGRGPGY